MQTRPLSKCMLLACAYQRARQRNMDIARNLAKALDNYLANEGCLEDPFSKQILRNYQPCVSTPNNSWTIQRMCQSKTLPIPNLAHNFYPATYEEHPMNNHDLDRVLFWKSCSGKKFINSHTGLGEGCYLRASSWALSLEPIHAMTYECYTCYKISIYSETNCGRYADDLRLPKDKAKEHGHCQ